MNRVLSFALLAVIGLAGCQDNKGPNPGVGTGKGGPNMNVADLKPADLEVKGAGLHKLQVQSPTGKTVKYAIQVPANLSKDAKVPLVVALHYAGKKGDWYGAGMLEGLYSEGCRSLGAVIVAPDSLTGDDWDNHTNADHVAWLARSVIQSYPIDPKKVILSGFSAGGIGTWYIAPRAPDVFTAAIPIAGEPELKGATWTVPVCAIHAEADTIIAPAATKRQIDKLKAEGKAAEFILLKDGTTHYQSGRYVRSLQEACNWLKGTWK
jgi:predicted peptidase